MDRVRSLITPKRDPSMDQVAALLDTIEGKNQPAKRDLPKLDDRQAMQALIVMTGTEPCFNCQGQPYAVQIYRVPMGLNRLGQSMILYTLCWACNADVSSKDIAERKLVAQLEAENA